MSIKLIFASTAALALIAGVPAHAGRSQSEQSAESDGGGSRAKAKEERKTCRTFDNTETRMKRERLCLTREQWRKFDDAQSE
ncbi:MAG: hypothetical protein QOJ27_296 [Sphingomonadales bacterium]|nr:hypothetical protein [Sphingomonadales bacterium]